MTRTERSGLQVATELAAFAETRLLPAAGVEPARFWDGLASLVVRFQAENAALLARRAALQAALDQWFASRAGDPDPAWLTDIGYLVPEGPAFQIATEGTDPEVARICGPQLVVPVTNARFALNAANARWGSLYDALYGSDALGPPVAGPYDPARGAQVIAWGRAFLDDAVPLAGAGHDAARAFRVVGDTLAVTLADGRVTGLADPGAFCGHIGAAEAPSGIVLRHHGLHLIIDLDRDSQIGRSDSAGISDIRLEAAITAIMDCEDSVATVDAADKVLAYGNWLGLMDGTLTESFDKGGRQLTRRLAGDIAYTGRDGQPARLKGRALMFVRNVGLLMTTPAIRTAAGADIPEGIMDALFTVTAAMADLRGARANSAASVYIVKPKLHGPDEVAFTVALFDAVEEVLGLPHNTVKLGIMDEERRTSVNLGECLRAARDRVAFVNTGFLDRTGDEIHSAMQAGPMPRKGDMKTARWLSAYEDRNVDIALAAGFAGRGQIGKGMWATPDRMADMLAAKIAHPQSGASCAWVPSPTAAVLHATHYHRVDVAARQAELARAAGQGPRQPVEALLSVPRAPSVPYTQDEIAAELLNNAQGILGYVVRWVDQGIGCSKVPDIHDIGQMEDRATCRISAQLLANWLRHGVIDVAALDAAFARAAGIVDRQNAADPAYRPLDPGSPAFQAARELVMTGAAQPSGYTEPVLHRWRARVKEGA